MGGGAGDGDGSGVEAGAIEATDGVAAGPELPAVDVAGTDVGGRVGVGVGVGVTNGVIWFISSREAHVRT